MAFDSIKKKVAETLGDEKQTDSALDRAEKFLNDRTGGKHADKIGKGRSFVDGKVGDEMRGDRDPDAGPAAGPAATDAPVRRPDTDGR